VFAKENVITTCKQCVFSQKCGSSGNF